jgi:hypothetical protein
VVVVEQKLRLLALVEVVVEATAALLALDLMEPLTLVVAVVVAVVRQ